MNDIGSNHEDRRLDLLRCIGHPSSSPKCEECWANVVVACAFVVTCFWSIIVCHSKVRSHSRWMTPMSCVVSCEIYLHTIKYRTWHMTNYSGFVFFVLFIFSITKTWLKMKKCKKMIKYEKKCLNMPKNDLTWKKMQKNAKNAIFWNLDLI